MSRKQKKPTSPVIRCAIYTRKSSEEGLELEFNSLDAQRESGEAFIASQQHEGWVCLPEHYDDGGLSGGSMDRPAMNRLIADIEAGKVDCVVVYKVDRLCRSLLDFSRIMESFDKHGVSFVSVTQQFNTTHSMGRLTLNILLSFAQFEREIIGERIRDRIAAQRRKGKWAGGVPVLGYDVDRTNPSAKLVVNAEEAVRVRRIFSLYMELGSLLPVVEEMMRRGWCNKSWTTKKGAARGGRPFDKCSVHALLTNPIYIGKIKHKTDVYTGEHESIIDADVFGKVQATLQKHSRGQGIYAAWSEFRGGDDRAVEIRELHAGRAASPQFYRGQPPASEEEADNAVKEEFCRPLAERFQVSREAMRIRLEGLDLIVRTRPTTLF